MMPFRRILKDLSTDSSGESYSVIAILGMAIVVVFLILSVWSFASGKPWDSVAYGTAAGLCIGALGASIKLAEPPKPPAEPK